MPYKKKRFLFVSISVFGAAILHAHTYPLFPVEIKLRVYPTIIRASLNSNQCYWSGEVLQVEMPPPAWTEPLRSRITKYMDDHFQLSVDGKLLNSHLQEIRYVQEPWQNSLEGRILCEFRYDLPVGKGKMLGGRATFFFEEWEEHLKSTKASHASRNIPQDFVTHVRIPGHTLRRFSLTLEKPDFELPLEEARRSAWQEKVDALFYRIKSMGTNLTTLGLAVLILAIVLRYRSRF